VSKTAGRFSLADIARATRAAKEQGAQGVVIQPDGTILIVLAGEHHCSETAKPEAEQPKPRDFEL